MKAHLNDTGGRPDGRHAALLVPRPGIVGPRHRRRSATTSRCSSRTPASWDDRPDAATGIPNLFLAADYVRTHINVTTMEGANEAARRAVNALLDESGSREAHAPRWDLYRAPEFEPWKLLDAERWRRHEPNIFDTDEG